MGFAIYILFQKIRNLSKLDHSPDLILMGNSLWHVKNTPEANDTLKVYQFLFRDLFKPVIFISVSQPLLPPRVSATYLTKLVKHCF